MPENLIRARLLSKPLKPVGETGMSSLKGMWQRRALLSLLIQREIKIRYKGTAFGVLWSMARPIVQLLVYYFAIGKILGAERGIDQFAIFIFVGFATWSLFAEIASTAVVCMTNNGGLIKKIYLPRELFVVTALGNALFTFSIYILILMVAAPVLGQMPIDPTKWQGFVGIGIAIVYATALGLVLAPLNVYMRDAQHFLDVALSILFWLTPIVYSFERVNGAVHSNIAEQLYLLNPMAIAVMGMQKTFWTAGSSVHWPADIDARLIIVFLVGLLLLFLAHRIFVKMQANLAQEL
ncbi:MAG: ABC transporter permease [Tropheryma whipplei]|uniref:ABC transporter permease n=1 Tax=Tropheryma whipplei TaxID=2039 RepID=UPI0004B233B6|nr:ABC transporter permease [Tropheryma whipplei]MCO8182845.1 ABC transporter permease [Tropheryma whipplei]